MRRLSNIVGLSLLAAAAVATVGASVDASADALVDDRAVASPAAKGPDVRAVERTHGLAPFDLAATQRLPALRGVTHRFGQSYKGVPVHGGGVAVRLGDDGAVLAETSHLARGLTVDPHPTLSVQDARSRVAALPGRHVATQPSVMLVIVPQQDLGGRLTYLVDGWEAKHGPARYFVDAHTGEVFQGHSLRFDARGQIYSANPGTPPATTIVDLTNLTATSTLDGRAAAVANFVSGDVEQGQNLVFEAKAKPDANGDYLFTPTTGFDVKDDFAQVNAYYHIDRMDTFFRDKLTVPMGYGLQVVVNYAPGNKAYDNAFFTPYQTARAKNLIVIGQGTSGDFSYDSDVFLHEFTHYVNHNTSNFNSGEFGDQYGMNAMPGGLDEGLADYFACTVNDHPVLGGPVLGGQARDLTKAAGKCPENMWGEPHQDGELVGNVTWRIRGVLGRDVADPIIWGAVQMLHNGATYADLAAGVLKGVDDAKAKGLASDAQKTQVRQALDELGFTACGRSIPLAMGVPVKSGFVGLTLLGQAFGGYSCSEISSQVRMTSLFQYQYVASATDKTASFSVSFEKASFPGVPSGFDSDMTYNYDLYLRKGQPVTFTGGLGGSSPYTAKGFDFKVTGFDKPEGTITLGDGGIGPLEPGATYYLAVLHTNCPSVLGTITVSPDAPKPELDAGVPDASPPDAAPPSIDATAPVVDRGAPDAATTTAKAPPSESGCGCSTVTSSDAGSHKLAGVALVVALAALRRRRRLS